MHSEPPIILVMFEFCFLVRELCIGVCITSACANTDKILQKCNVSLMLCRMSHHVFLSKSPLQLYVIKSDCAPTWKQDHQIQVRTQSCFFFMYSTPAFNPRGDENDLGVHLYQDSLYQECTLFKHTGSVLQLLPGLVFQATIVDASTEQPVALLVSHLPWPSSGKCWVQLPGCTWSRHQECYSRVQWIILSSYFLLLLWGEEEIQSSVIWLHTFAKHSLG